MDEIRPLTALRGAFALWVLAFHIALMSGLPHGQPIASYGYLGVEFFFALSGFILAGAYGGGFAGGLSASLYAKFLNRRVWRLFPLHLAVLGAMILAGAVPAQTSFYSAARELTLTNMWFYNATRINGPDWSISEELLVNLFFPALAILSLGRGRGRGTVAAMSAIACVAGLVVTARSNDWSLNTIETMPAMTRCFCEFYIGMVLYRFRGAAGVLSSDGVLIGLAAVLAVLVVARAPDLLMVAAMMCGLVGLSQNAGSVAKFLSAPPLLWIGHISFSIYLIQVPIIRLAIWAIGAPTGPLSVAGLFALCTVMTLAVAALTHRQIELRFKRGFASAFRAGSSRPAFSTRESRHL